MDEEEKELPPHGIGEIVLRGTTITKGYWNNPEATKKAIVDGWLHTATMGYWDEEIRHGRALALPWLGLDPLSSPADASPAGSGACSAGAHTLSPPGSRVYPETGNGGYTSLHTLMRLVYDATTNRFLPGNRVVLTDRATQCLTSFSLDFERRSGNTSAGRT